MKHIEQVKFICGLILVLFPIIGGVSFYLESFGNFKGLLNSEVPSVIFGGFAGRNSEASSTSIFLGICGIAGAYLLASVNQNKSKN